MNKDELLAVLADWNFWKKDLDTGIERNRYVEKCLKLLKTNVALAIIGARRAGKSYIMRQMIKRLAGSGVEKKNIMMINLEDRRFADLSLKSLDEIYEAYTSALKPDKTPFVFLDEVHKVPGWEKWVRNMHELGKAKMVVSGSSSDLLKGELATVLTGRHLDIFVYPLSFGEFLMFKKIQVKDELDMASKKAEIRASLEEYFEFGGFPETVLSGDKKQLLLSYYDDMLTKDIERRYKLKKAEKLRALARFYMTNIASPVTFNSLGRAIGTTTVTVEKFSSYMEKANMLFFIKRFSFKVKEQEKAARKVYIIDTGMANAVGFKFSSDTGKLAENIIAVELRRMAAADPNLEIYYWTDPQKKEVDFVIKEGSKVKQLVQSCWDITGYKAKERETKALLKASKDLKCSSLLVITGNFEGKEKTGGKTIRYVPLWKWLLEK